MALFKFPTLVPALHATFSPIWVIMVMNLPFNGYGDILHGNVDGKRP